MHGDEETAGADDVGLDLLSCFRCRTGDTEIRLPHALCALIVTVALEPGGLSRASVQSRLWPDVPSPEAGKRLRQALWRVRRETGDRVLDVTPAQVALAGGVDVDLREAERVARAVVKGEARAVAPAGTALLARELLPGWTDEGVRAARDRWDRLRLHALERLAEHALASGDAPGAIELAEAATRVDELGETPHRLTAAAHLARGDHVSAWRVFLRYRRLLIEEIGLEPSSLFRNLFQQPEVRSLVS
ncbi:AfsR/SARP family transcriptional regulator [Actinomadura rubrisoli]|uniref:Bacterial transcriptional activator domain-containing protein n=1 Tax=Actinomadura rubrisoli TaxID=2530368 RepID=A0A4R5BGS7_9ACTN|nr:bacterial transcriptional activator domain-containing protein [Actinomadura rubrisoli]TDD85631.1 hypothetical protein E1298_18440 [Actinomadura rubrisoli]